jgi:hypothetical protein
MRDLVGEAPGQGGAGVVEVVGELGDQAVAVGGLGVDRVAEHEELGGAAVADEPREEVRRPHVTAGEPDLGEEEGEPRLRRADPEVGGDRDHAAGAGRDPLDAGDDRDRALAHRPDHVTGHLGEAHQAGGVHLDQLADDLVDVAAAAEALALATDHEHPGVAAVRQLGQEVAEVGVALEGERVQLLGPVEGHRGDPVGDGEVEVLPLLGEPGARAVPRHWMPFMSPRAMIVRCTSEAPS